MREFDGYTQGTTGAGDANAVGAGRIIDIADERAPRVVANLRLQVNQPAEHAAASSDPGAGSPVQGYAAHYCSLSSEVDPTIVACSFITSGLRAFDISDLLHPKEIAYYVAPTQPRAENEFLASDFAMSKPVIVPSRREGARVQAARAAAQDQALLALVREGRQGRRLRRLREGPRRARRHHRGAQARGVPRQQHPPPAAQLPAPRLRRAARSSARTRAHAGSSGSAAARSATWPSPPRARSPARRLLRELPARRRPAMSFGRGTGQSLIQDLENARSGAMTYVQLGDGEDVVRRARRRATRWC